MVEDSIEVFMKDFKKYNIGRVCVLGCYLFKRYIPDSKLLKRFLFRNKKYYCLHLWIEHRS